MTKQETVIENTLKGTYFEGAEFVSAKNLSTFIENSCVFEGSRTVIRSGEIVIRMKNGKELRLIFKSDNHRGGIKGYVEEIYGKDERGRYTELISPKEISIMNS